jgi:GST-like protein
VGKHPLQLYSLATPNGVKVTVMLEELLALGHSRRRVRRVADPHQRGRAVRQRLCGVNPNSKIPALLDRSGPEPVRVFESGAILLYLAEKFGAFLPKAARRAPSACRGCSGRWAARPTWAAALATFMPMRRARSNTPSTASRWRSSASSTCSTAAWPRAATWPGTTTPLPTSPPGPGTAPGQGQLYDAGEFLQVQNTPTWSLGRRDRQRPAVQRGRMVNRMGRPGQPVARAPRRQRL